MKNQQRDNFIVEWYEEVSVKAIADYLGITVESVYSRAYRLGLSKPRQKKEVISDEDLRLIHELVGTVPKNLVALKFSITMEELEHYLKIEPRPV